MAAIARAPDESLPRQLGSVAGAKAAYRLFDCGAVTREAVMDPHLAQCRTAAARHRVVLMVHDNTTLDFSAHRRLPRRWPGRRRDRVPGAQLPGRAALGRDAGPGPSDDLGAAAQGCERQTRESAVWAEMVTTIGRPPAGSIFVSVANRGADVFEPLESVRETGWDAVVRAAQDRRLVTGGGSLTALRTARAIGAATDLTRQGEAVVCVAWRELELLPPRNSPASRVPIQIWGVRVWNDTLEWLLLTTRPVETLDQALEITAWYARRWTVEEFKAWKTGCRAEQRQLAEADRLVLLPGALAIVAVRLLGLRDAARCEGAAPADVPETTIRILAAKFQQPAKCFTTDRDFLRGIARLGGFLARKSDGEPG